MYESILLATDGSPDAEQAADAALALADTFGAMLQAVHVLELGDLPPGAEDPDADDFARRGTAALEAVAERAADAGVPATTSTLEGSGAPHELLVEHAAREGVDLIVVGTAGHTGLDRFVLGSTAEQTLRTAPVPVLTVHEDTPLETIDTILVPTDGSEPARRAASHAIDLALATGASLAVLNVVDVGVVYEGAGGGMVLDTLEDAGEAAVASVVEMAEAAGVDAVESEVLLGQPANTIVEHAADVDASLVVVGTRGRTGLDRLLIGSVAERVVRRAEVPVLGVRQPQE